LTFKENPSGPIIDVNVRVGKSAYGLELSGKQCLSLMDEYGIQISVISAFTPCDYSFERANSAIERIVREYPSRLKGMVRVDPRIDGSQNVLRKFLRKKSFVGVSLNPFEQAFKVTDPVVRPAYEIAEQFNCPVMIESGYSIVSLPSQVAEVAAEFRKVNFIMTHAGQLLASGQSESDSLYSISENRNLYCDTSQIILSGIGGFIEQVVKSNENGSKRRVMFGSNSPSGEISVELLRVQKSNIDEHEKELLFFENAKKLFDI